MFMDGLFVAEQQPAGNSANKDYYPSGDKMSVDAQMVVVPKALVEGRVSLGLGHPFEFSWLDVSQTDVFHRFFSSLWEPSSRALRAVSFIL
jgi:hypothetical protein